jgi:hypothetical protein
MPKVIIDETQILPINKNRFWNSDDADAKTIRTKWDTYINSNKVTFTKNVTILEDGRTQIVSKSIWNDQADYNEWQNWYNSGYSAKRIAYNEANGIIVNRNETIE